MLTIIFSPFIALSALLFIVTLLVRNFPHTLPRRKVYFFLPSSSSRASFISHTSPGNKKDATVREKKLHKAVCKMSLRFIWFMQLLSES